MMRHSNATLKLGGGCGHGGARSFRSWRRGASAFTIVELLAVIGILVLMIAAVAPLASSIQAGRSVTTGAHTLSGLLEEGQIYAKANNTYVWVGFFEENADSAINSGTAGKGRIIGAAVASLDGTREALNDPTKLELISRLVRIDSMEIVSTLGSSGGEGWPETDPLDQVASFPTGTNYFKYPLTGTTKYSFSKVIQFNPLGEASKPNSNPSPWIAMGFRQIKGSDSSSGNDANSAAIFVEGLSGRARIYRK